MCKKILFMLCALSLAAGLAITISCASGPVVQPEPEAKPEPPTPPGRFTMKPFHRSMSEEMRKSYDLADEIIIGIFENSHEDDEAGLVYYFQDFSTFDKSAQAWSEPMNVIMKVQPDVVKPEVIYRNEYKNLIDLDKVGICWDVYEGDRNVFLVEGSRNLIFVKLGYDEANNRSHRSLIDAYPVTEICRADDVFAAMLLTLPPLKEGRPPK